MEIKKNKFTPFTKKIQPGPDGRSQILGSDNCNVMHSGFVTLKKGECIGEHSTHGNEELIIILEGEAEVEAEGAGRKPVSKGEVAYNPPNTKHNVYNVKEELLKYIYVVARVG
ncbi:MAG: cupin domain-containing protein [Ignavibacteria bacterium]|nr:cupin domain-containing protein [Ignavibacteria bacterium]